MAFYSHFIPSGLSDDDYRRVTRVRPMDASSRRRDPSQLLRDAGFIDIVQTDLTSAFLKTARAWHSSRHRYQDRLIESEGGDVFWQRQMDYARLIEIIEAGLLHRALFLARRS